MRDHVYLYELDSVRNSKQEILAGQQAMFREIIQRGNCVVITYNQLADSPTFLQTLQFPETYEHLLGLFANGSLKISRYIDRARPDNPETRTAAQYILHALNKALCEEEKDADKFIFSGLPVRRGNSALLAAIRDAIRYSDPARISDLIEIRSDASRKAQWETLGIRSLSVEDLQYVLRYVNLILLLSREPLSHIPAKSADQKVMLFTEYLGKMLRSETTALAQNYAALAPHYADAVGLLLWLQTAIVSSKQQSRSSWLNELQDMDGTNKAVLMAEAIIDLCYNYTVEDSILGVTKRFGDTDEAFTADYLDRLSAFWQEHLSGGHILHEGNTAKPHIRANELPDWSLAVSTTDEALKIKSFKARKDEDPQAQWQRLSRRGLIRKILGTLLYVPLFFIVEQSIGLLETLFTGDLPFLFLSALITTYIFGLLSSLISKWITLPDLSDTVKNIGTGIRNLLALRKTQNGGKKA